MLETINKNQVNIILNKNTDEIATLIEKHRNTMITSKKIIKLKEILISSMNLLDNKKNTYLF